MARQPLAVRCGSSAGGERHVTRSTSGPSAARSEVWLISRWRAAFSAEYEWPVSCSQWVGRSKEARHLMDVLEGGALEAVLVDCMC